MAAMIVSSDHPLLSTLLKTAKRRALIRGVVMKALRSARVLDARLDDRSPSDQGTFMSGTARLAGS